MLIDPQNVQRGTFLIQTNVRILDIMLSKENDRREHLMDTCNLDKLTQARDLVSLAQGSDEPVVVFDGEDECLVAMRPAVFERILFETNQLNCGKRGSLHL